MRNFLYLFAELVIIIAAMIVVENYLDINPAYILVGYSLGRFKKDD